MSGYRPLGSGLGAGTWKLMLKTQAALTFPAMPSTGSVLLTGPIHPQSCPISLPPAPKLSTFFPLSESDSDLEGEMTPEEVRCDWTLDSVSSWVCSIIILAAVPVGGTVG